jgi:hypothetical protein
MLGGRNAVINFFSIAQDMSGVAQWKSADLDSGERLD